MLTHDELLILLKKDTLKLEDLLLLESHLLSIAKLQEEYVDLPQDVVEVLNNDIELILERLKIQRLSMQKPRLRLLTSENK